MRAPVGICKSEACTSIRRPLFRNQGDHVAALTIWYEYENLETNRYEYENMETNMHRCFITLSMAIQRAISRRQNFPGSSMLSIHQCLHTRTADLPFALLQESNK
jgi:hypothetical protein